MLGLPFIKAYRNQHGLTERDAFQTFMQVVVLRHLSLPGVRLIGGTALVLGHGNPRFSEDVDLTQVHNPNLLSPGLHKAAAELEKWLGNKIRLIAPKPGNQTWRLNCPLSRGKAIRLHVDSQSYPAYTVSPIVIQFSSLQPLVYESISIQEIMADKIIALAYRSYLGGRDLFDLWFHWLRQDNWQTDISEIRGYIQKKIRDRSWNRDDFMNRLTKRLSEGHPLTRARVEWRRYLPAPFQTKTIQESILNACRNLPGIFHDAH